MSSRLDILIYAHDGRGLGHASRSIGIGIALRRLYPDLKVLFISGSPFTAELIGPAPLDHLKLPAYATEIVQGKSRGITGPSNFSDRETGELRSAAIKQVLELYTPRVALCDHSPLGKHRELLPALGAATDTQWILGVRGVVGAVPQVFSELARETFKRYFSAMLWYGDETVLGSSTLDELAETFGCPPHPCGYVSRLAELVHYEHELFCSSDTAEPSPSPQTKKYGGTISIPWQGEYTVKVIRNLTVALKAIGPGYGEWMIFLGPEPCRKGQSQESELSSLPHVRVEQPGRKYGKALAGSKTALIYGGYNSITDVLSLNIPAVVLLRSLQDREQEEHLQRLQQKTGNQLCLLPEQEVTADLLEQLLRRQLTAKNPERKVHLDGARSAAQQLAGAVLGL